MAKFLGWTCLVIGILIIIFSAAQIHTTLTKDWAAVWMLLVYMAFRAVVLILGVALIVLGYRKLKWVRAEEAYYKAVGGRPDDDDQEASWDEQYDDD